jgi:cysteine-rich repeat protein
MGQAGTRTLQPGKLSALAAIMWLASVQGALASTVNFTAVINGLSEVPANLSLATAAGTFTMDTDANTLSYNITILIPPPTGELFSHIHGFSAPGANSGILHTLPNGSPKVGVWNFTEAQQANIIADLTYVNIHSPAFMNGEIRGQITRLASCGDTVVDITEQCDDGNTANGDCCNSLCLLETDGSACDDGDLGTINDQCTAGVCGGNPNPCGDGNLDGGEQCDDGNLDNGDCCDSTCQLEPDGSACDDGNGNTTGDQCEAGSCAGTFLPNNFLCRQIRDLHVPARFTAETGITVVDQTGSDTCEAKKPFLLCDPADTNGGGVPNPALHYCCYKLKCTLKPAVNYDVTDQFWSGRISTKKPKFLCNPCTTAAP